MENSNFLHGIEHLLRYGLNELPDGVKLVLTVNDQTGNVWLTAQDVDAVPISTRINGKSLAKSVELTPDDIQALALKSVEVGEGQVIRADGATITDLIRRLRDIEGTQVVITVNNKTGPNITLSAADVGASPSNHGHSDLVPALRTINKKALTGDITLSHSDVGAAASSHTHSDLVPTARKVNNKALSADITLSASDVGAAASSHSHSDLVPTARKVNNKALSADITLSASDVGAPTTADLKAVSDRVGNLEGVDVTFEELPFPDVWIPFSDSLVMLAGYGDEIKVGSYVVARMASFSRASGATYIDKSGNLRAVAINEPRFEKEGLLIEGQSTNTHMYSDYTLSNFSKTRCSCELSDLEGGIQWYKQIATEGTSSAYVYLQGGNSQTFELGKTYTYSVLIKKGSTSTFRVVKHSDSFPSNATAVFSFDTETFSSIGVGLISAQSTKIRDGVYKISITATCDKENGRRSALIWQESYTIGDYWFMANPQIEELPFASSYIPTNGAAATRAADYCYADSLLNHLPMSETEEQTFSITFDKMGNIRNGGNTSLFQNVFQISRNYNLLRIDGTDLRHYRSGAATFSTGVSDNTPYIAAWKTSSGDKVSASINGSMKATNFVRIPTGGYGTVTRFWLGSGTASSHLFGHIRNLRIWHRALTDNQLKSIR